MRKPSPSLIVSSAALVVALGGTGYAAATLTGKDIKNGTLTSADVANGSLKSKDFKSGQLPAGAQGPQGPQGLPGTPGADGADGADGIGRWALVDATGAIIASSGGFEVKAAYGQFTDGSGATPAGAIANVYIDANEPLDDNGVVVTVALQNGIDQNANGNMNGLAAGPDVNPEFSGEVTATMCGIPMVVTCAPMGTNDINHFVVSPRLSDGSPTTADNRKRFYVVITGDSSDYVAPPTP